MYAGEVLVPEINYSVVSRCFSDAGFHNCRYSLFFGDVCPLLLFLFFVHFFLMFHRLGLAVVGFVVLPYFTPEIFDFQYLWWFINLDCFFSKFSVESLCVFFKGLVLPIELTSFLKSTNSLSFSLHLLFNDFFYLFKDFVSSKAVFPFDVSNPMFLDSRSFSISVMVDSSFLFVSISFLIFSFQAVYFSFPVCNLSICDQAHH